MVLETLTGETLSHLIDRRRRRLAANDLAVLGLHMCSALHYLHGNGLLHVNLKPSNIVVGCRRAKLLDLSIARPPGPAPPGIGTFCHLAPEQARGGMLRPAADVWGIGITLYEAATGDVPFDHGVSSEECGAPARDAGGASRKERQGAESVEGGASGEDVEGPESAGGGEGASGSQSAQSGENCSYPQLDERAPSVAVRRRLPRGLAATIDGCLDPDPAARPPLAQLAAELDRLLPHGLRRPAVDRSAGAEPAPSAEPGTDASRTVASGYRMVSASVRSVFGTPRGRS
ncbi:hypothetical protein GCM10010211_73850 [Streptomyces albospinus]|uniref:non-specific serine/threonine protein kinase n=1 Tax=Streptomyces albospinus TaxID=285515 RepID=A0ABQ2VL52_9ACTN|nr:protein kinase [Streptomyces albospinus]GGU95950.1 hypothetical protein GCM10010211_73850 [Streptomyces albospinus]